MTSIVPVARAVRLAGGMRGAVEDRQVDLFRRVGNPPAISWEWSPPRCLRRDARSRHRRHGLRFQDPRNIRRSRRTSCRRAARWHRARQDVAVIWTPWTESGPPRGELSSRVVAFPQSGAGLDQRVAAGIEIEVALVVIAILQVEPAGRLAVPAGKPTACCCGASAQLLSSSDRRGFRAVAQHFALSGIGERGSRSGSGCRRAAPGT